MAASSPARRREKLAKLRELGIDPFGSRFEVSTTPGELRADFTEGRQVKVAGRITALRDMGKSVFFQLGDVLGSIQGYVGIKNLSEEQAAAWKCLARKSRNRNRTGNSLQPATGTEKNAYPGIRSQIESRVAQVRLKITEPLRTIQRTSTLLPSAMLSCSQSECSSSWLAMES